MSANPDNVNSILAIRANPLMREYIIEALKKPALTQNLTNFQGLASRQEALDTVDFKQVSLIVTKDDFTSPTAREFLQELKNRGHGNIPVLFIVSPDGMASFDTKIIDTFKNTAHIKEPYKKEELEIAFEKLLTGENPVPRILSQWLTEKGFSVFARQGPQNTQAVSEIWDAPTKTGHLIRLHATKFSYNSLETYRHWVQMAFEKAMDHDLKIAPKEVIHMHRDNNDSSITIRAPGL